MCSGICPKARVKKGFNPRRIVYSLVTGNKERLDDSGDAWDCLTCGQCQDVCPMGVDFLDMFRAERKDSACTTCPIAHDNTVGTAFYDILRDPSVRPNRRKFLAEDVETDDSSDTLYFMGCLPYFDIVFSEDVGFEGMAIADNAIRLLNAVGIVPAVEEKCCGHDQLWRGQDEYFQDFGEQNAGYLKKYKLIVTACPECYRTLAVDYREKLGMDLNVRHISEVLAENMDKLPEGKVEGITATFHDSCRLGRHMRVYEPPRNLLLKAGYKLEEMTKAGEESLCCGVSAWVNCDDENTEIRRRKMTDARETGAQRMVIPCLKCQIHLKCLLRYDQREENDIEILDLTTALAEGLLEKKETR
jgi:Fe-S oxidoreductase